MKTWSEHDMDEGLISEPGTRGRGRPRASGHAVYAAAAVLTLAFLAGCNSSLTDVLGSNLQTAAPTFNLEPGTYEEDISVELASETEGAIIYFTTDGTDPTVSGEQYGGPIELSGDSAEADVRAYATAEGRQPSSVVRGEFFIEYPALANPIFRTADGTAVASGTFQSDLQIDLVTEEPNATIHYTIADGGSVSEPDPDNSATQTYTGTPISIAGDGTVKTISAIATSETRDTSGTATATFTIEWPELSLASSGNGTVSFADGGGTDPRAVEAGTSVEIQATPESGFQFGTWSVTSGDAQSVEFTDATAATTEVTLGAEDVTVTGSFLDEAAPNAPDVSGPSLTNNPRPSWSWTPGGGGNGTFRYKLNDADLSSGATVTNATTFTPGSDLADDNHTLYVQEQDDAGNWSATVTVDTTAPGQPGIEGVSDGFVSSSVTFTVAWAESDGTREYRTTSGGSWQSYTEELTISSAGHYEITARQIDAAGNVSQPAPTVTGSILFAAPSSLTATTQNADRIDLSWQDNSDGEGGFEVQRKEGEGGTYAEVASVSVGATDYQDTGLDSETTYYYRVRATGGALSSNWSNEGNDTTEQLSAPSGLSASAVSSTEIDLSWSDTGELESEDTYEIERDSTVIDTVGADTTSYTDTGLSAETQYSYRVRAVDAGGASAWSSQASQTTPTPDPGDPQSFSATGISWTMRFVPAKSFPTETDDSGSATVGNDFWLAETEVTYELWYAVREWAENGTGGAAGEGQYSFGNPGREGDDGTDGAAPTGADQEPVTEINWRDAMLWTNALTEWYNDQTGASLEPVYYTDSGYTTPIRTVDDSTSVDYPNPGSQDDPYVKSDADGFRLPGMDEWELAARYIEDANADGDIEDSDEYYPGDYASGADARHDASSASQDLDDDGDQDITGDVGWYDGNSGSNTHDVATKDDNALGLYDMSGNVWEWNFDWDPSFVGTARVARGGSWYDSADNLQVGDVGGNVPYNEDGFVGFRPARNAQ